VVKLNEGLPLARDQTERDNFWAFLIALSEIEDYVGRVNPQTGELEIKHKDEITPQDNVIDLEARRANVSSR
jgi:hypothetical protein